MRSLGGPNDTAGIMAAAISLAPPIIAIATVYGFCCSVLYNAARLLIEGHLQAFAFFGLTDLVDHAIIPAVFAIALSIVVLSSAVKFEVLNRYGPTLKRRYQLAWGVFFVAALSVVILTTILIPGAHGRERGAYQLCLAYFLVVGPVACMCTTLVQPEWRIRGRALYLLLLFLLPIGFVTVRGATVGWRWVDCPDLASIQLETKMVSRKPLIASLVEGVVVSDGTSMEIYPWARIHSLRLDECASKK